MATANPFDQFDGAKPARNPFDQFDHPLIFDSSGLLDAAARGFAQGATQPMDPDTVKLLRDAGIFNDYDKGQRSIVRTFNEALASQVIDPLFRRLPQGIYGAVRGMAEAEPNDILGRGISAAAGAATGAMEAFPAGRETGLPMPEHGAGPSPETASTEGAAAIEPPPLAEPAAPATTVEPAPAAPEAAPTAAPAAEPAAAPDIHAVARQIAPDTFGEYDALSARRDTFRRWLDELSETRANSDQAKGLQDKIGAILDRVGGVEDKLTKAAGQRLEAARNDLDGYLRADTPDMARVRGDLQDTDYRMRNLAPDVSAAYRSAAEQMPAEPAEAAVTPEAPSQPDIAPVAAEAPPAPPQTPVEMPADNPPAVPSPAEEEPRPYSPGRMRVAARDPDGTVWIGKPGQIHADLVDNAANAEMGFADAKGNFLTREEAVKAIPPETKARLSAGEGGLDAADYEIASRPVVKSRWELTAEPLETGISGDVSKRLVAVGRPAEEADAAGALVQAHYEARAERFGGAKGSAEDLYNADAPAVRAGVRVRAAENELQPAQSRRGNIRLATDNAKATITLFKDSDASTFIHESGHQWLEELTKDAADPQAPPDLVGDNKTVRDWLGVDEGAVIPRKAHEKFARGFERYMMEGHAPSRALAGVFGKFRDWLTGIYQTVSRLRSPINDDIRGVFDRMLASKDEGEPVIAPEAPEPVREFGPEGKAPPADGVYSPVPREPMRLVDFLKKNGGLRDDMFSKRESTARGRADAKANPTEIRSLADNPRGKGLIKARTGLPHDEAALRAWEEGYFPDHPERPTVDDLYSAIHDDLNDRPRYSKHDDTAVKSFQDAVSRNAEIDRLADAMGVNPREMTREQFFDKAAEHLSVEHSAREIGALDAETEREINEARERAKEWAASRGDAWEPDAGNAGDDPRTLEDLERAYEHEREAAAQSGGSEGGVVSPGPSAADTGAVQEGAGQGGRSAGSTGRAGSGASEVAAETPDATFASPETRLIDKAGNIRLDNIDTPEDFKQALRDSAERNGDFLGRRRGVVSDTQRDALADVMGTTPDKVLTKAIGESFSDSEIKMLERALAQSTGRVRDLAEKFVQTGAEADDLAMTEAFLRHDMLQGLYSQATAEAGRAFRALQKSKEYWSSETASTQMTMRDGLGDVTGRSFNQRLDLARKILSLDQAGSISKFVRDAQRPGLFDWVQSAFINALLSGPFTHLGYTAAGEMFGLFRGVAETGAAAGVGAVRRAAGIGEAEYAHIGEVQHQVYGQMRGAWRGLKASWRAIKENQTILPAEVERQPSMPGTGQAVVGGSRAQIIPNPRGIPIGTVLESPSRLVSALHTVNWTTFYEQSKSAQAFRAAVHDGLEGDALSARVALLTDNPTDAMIRQASEDADSGALVTRPAYDSIMGKVSRLTNHGIQLPDVSLPGGAMLPLGTLRPLKFIDPFVQIAANVQKAAFGRNTPLALLSQSARDDLMMRNGGPAFDRTAGRILAGTAFMSAAGGLYFAGMMNPTGPRDPREAAVWQRVHGMPHGLNVGSLSFDMLRLGPLGLQMSVAADLAHAIEHIGKDDADKVASNLVQSFAQNIVDESFARGPEALMKATDDPDRYGAAWIRSFVSSAMPFSVGLGQVAHEVDPYVHRARTMMEAFQTKIPLASRSLQPVYDVWGDPIPARGWAGTYYEHVSNDPIDRQLEKLGVYPSPPGRHIDNIELTEQQYADYSRIAGRHARMLIEQALGLPGFATMPPEGQIKLIDHTIEGARKQAAGIVITGSAGGSDDLIAKRRAAGEAAIGGASHEQVKELRKVH